MARASARVCLERSRRSERIARFATLPAGTPRRKNDIHQPEALIVFLFLRAGMLCGHCVEDIGNCILILDARQLSVFQVKVIPSPASDFGEGPVAGPFAA